MRTLKNDPSLKENQLKLGVDSPSDFQNTFFHLLEKKSTPSKPHSLLHTTWFQTPLGPMVAVADEKALYLLEFTDCRKLEKKLERLCKRTASHLVSGKTAPLKLIEKEIEAYFQNPKEIFKTSFHLAGSPFQKRVWEELLKIPSGKTCSYAEIAQAIGHPTACRAVANANGANQLALLIPCHRVINTDGQLGGYGGGVHRKSWLLAHEQ